MNGKKLLIVLLVLFFCGAICLVGTVFVVLRFSKVAYQKKAEDKIQMYLEDTQLDEKLKASDVIDDLSDEEIKAIANGDRTVDDVISEKVSSGGIINQGESLNDTLSKKRDAKRSVDVTSILVAVSQYMIEPGKSINDFGYVGGCSAPSHIGTNGVDLNKYLVPDFIVLIPTDPKDGTTADTGYTICKETNGKITVAAPNAEGEPINVSR